ncbi:alkanesulfonate monooxygenase SsuD/methylene tetrahydromethanopterin reductase-like flavin-dependent oxidoreductase (luciferase family) [Frondihabitans sp. PhB188]|uniref:LLM class flavin-dependent oxidoreductase n=1 Tax=Frondihabitans sp. PhB188 TaxID=2485200 RepID=UPI000F4A0C35|nr:LLM class flavin-dependent oxidoreductase [Frondihabitans sp. PhB188]ROQ38586.1 alkanesulfonate monooxygenase SsuD/methylene tetrahydromethanopterin reductase-like flavin-dependent oxidoreductase (luciferase family) [Frondihabitans sp. PhB188]
MARLQHFGWFFGRGFGPQGWLRPDWHWNLRWDRPGLYQQSATELERAGLDLLIIEDSLSPGPKEQLDLRVRGALGAPKLDPLQLTPWLFAATEHLGVAPTVNAGVLPPYLAARSFATLQHLSDYRVGINVVTDVKGSRHFGIPELDHDASYDRAEEWMHVVRRLWHSWADGAVVEDTETWRYADGAKLDAFEHRGEYFSLDGPLNAPPFDGNEGGKADGDPVIVSPGGSGRGLEFAGRNSDVQLALARLDVETVRAYRARIHEAARAQGRVPASLRILFVLTPEIVASTEEADRLVAASAHPSDSDLHEVIERQSIITETDLTGLDLDRPLDLAVFGQHVSKGSIGGLVGNADPATPLRELFTAKYRKGRISDGTGFVGTVGEIADFIEELGDDADNDGFIFNGDLHPATVHRTLDALVPELRQRGILRRELGGGGLRSNLLDF